MGTNPERTVEVVSVSLKDATDTVYAQELSPGLKPLAMLNYPLLSSDVAFHTCEETLKKEISKHPDTPILSLSLAALEQRDSAKFSDSDLSANDQDVIAEIRRQGDICESTGKSIGAPTGWFLDELKSKILGGDVAKTVEEKRRKNAARMVPKLWTTAAIQLLLTAIGGLFFIKVLLDKKLDKDFATVFGANFTGRTCLAMLLVGLYSSLAVSLPLGMVQALVPSYFPQELYTSAMSFGAYLAELLGFLLCIYFWLLKPNGTTFVKAFDLTTTAAEVPMRFAQGFVGFTIMIFFCALTTILQVYFTKIYDTSNPIVLEILVSLERQSVLQVVLNCTMVAILGPFIEEVFFRGMLYRWLRQKLTLIPSLIISSAFFALMHFDPAQLPALMVGGMVFAYLYERTRSLLPGMICHCLGNSLFLLLTIFVR